MPVTLEELSKVQLDVTPAEINRARAQLKAGLLMSLESTGSRCEQLARQWQIFGRVIPAAETVKKIEAVTEADIRAAAAKIFSSRPTLATIGPIAQVPRLGHIIDRLAA
jgi:predicted Zn-dependent peptidase